MSNTHTQTRRSLRVVTRTDDHNHEGGQDDNSSAIQTDQAAIQPIIVDQHISSEEPSGGSADTEEEDFIVQLVTDATDKGKGNADQPSDGGDSSNHGGNPSNEGGNDDHPQDKNNGKHNPVASGSGARSGAGGGGHGGDDGGDPSDHGDGDYQPSEDDSDNEEDSHEDQERPGHPRNTRGERQDTSDTLRSSSSLPRRDDYLPAARVFDGFLQRLNESGGGGKGADVRRPDKFTGKDRSKFRTFKVQCLLVFRSNPHKFKSDAKKVNYACSYLDEVAFSWYENALDQDEEPDWFYSWDLFIKELDKNFGEVDVTAAAERRIRQLWMSSTGHVSDYITKFNAEANKLKWNDSAKMSEFRRGLAPRIKDELARVPDINYHDYIDFQDVVLRLDARYWEREAERSNDSRSRGTTPSTSAAVTRSTTTTTTNRFAKKIPERYARANEPVRPFGRSQPTDFARRTQGSSSSSSSGSSGSYKGFAKPLKHIPLTADGKVTQAEKDKRMREGSCLYCGEKGHILATCPKKPPSSNARFSEATFQLRSGN